MLVVGRLAARTSNAMLAFAAGVMLAATVFSLLLPGFALAEPRFSDRRTAAAAMVAAMAAGGWRAAIHRLLPHEHFERVEGPGATPRPRLAVRPGVAVHGYEGCRCVARPADAAIGVTLGIGLQNLPEGLAVAMSLAGLGYGRGQALGVAALTGAVELIGGLAGAGLLAISQALLPLALGFAAGTMLFVISDEVIPETHRAGFGDSATAALFTGFGLMFFLDVALG